MKKLFTIFLILSLPLGIFLSGCSENISKIDLPINKDQGAVILPIAKYGERLTYKAFGEFIEDRFHGYHVGDDIEYQDTKEKISVKAIADGIILQSGNVSGYGGLVVIQHTVKNTVLTALYGHIDLSLSSLKKGDAVRKGQFLANLGEHKSQETDGERKHLHFALYQGNKLRQQGYEPLKENVSLWINPYQFFLENGVNMTKNARSFEPSKEVGGEIFKIQFRIPEGWEVEYIPSLKALNFFTLAGKGTARERSQIFILYFDASAFLTLGTVKIYQTRDLTIGTISYTARQYDIEKKAGVKDFSDQPVWRNKRHIVTDFRNKDGFTRYYVIAANPELDKAIYESVLASMTIVNN